MLFNLLIFNWRKVLSIITSLFTSITWDSLKDDERENKPIIYFGRCIFSKKFYTVQSNPPLNDETSETWSWVLTNQDKNIIDTRVGYKTALLAKVGAQENADSNFPI